FRSQGRTHVPTQQNTLLSKRSSISRCNLDWRCSTATNRRQRGGFGGGWPSERPLRVYDWLHISVWLRANYWVDFFSAIDAAHISASCARRGVCHRCQIASPLQANYARVMLPKTQTRGKARHRRKIPDQPGQGRVRRLFSPCVLVEDTEHRERHGLYPVGDGRLRHRREQG